MDPRRLGRRGHRIKLGDVELIEPIASGGAGEIWRARHIGEGLAVAVKVMHGNIRRDERAQSMFRREVRAVARLDHPGIIKVFDHGEIPREAADASDNRLFAGSPYLVMELCPHGSLERYAPEGWNGVRKILLSLLQALAHAHARGVVHRDVKPANVLLGSTEEGQAHFDRLLLTDFGIAHAIGPGAKQVSDAVTGTPHYMAPEQVLGRTRDLGPWTDLYSIGCVAWELLTGQAPFGHLDGRAVMQAHVSSEPPALRPGVPVPAELASWMARMLDKDHRYRFQCAADAAWALMTMGLPVDKVLTERSFAPMSVATARFTMWGRTLDSFDPKPATEHVGGGTFHNWDFEDTDDDTIPTSVMPDEPDTPQHIPPFPDSWHRTQEAPRAMRLVRAGLGLWGMRPPPMVGRTDHRDALWEALSWVRRYRHPRAVMLRGRAGLGKSRLAEWTAERAEELGAATVLRGTHDESGGGDSGLLPVLARRLSTNGLERAGLTAQVRRSLQPLGLDTNDEVLDMLAFLGTDAEQAERFDGPKERYAVLVRYLRAQSQERPTMIWLDDLQWGADALAFMGQLLDEPDLPVLLVGTVQVESLASSSLEAQWLDWLAEHPAVDMRDITPLHPDEQRALVESLLGLDARLVDAIVDRTGGNPLFAVQIIGDWIQRGNFVPGAHGFQLADDVRLDIPDDVHSLWMRRLHAVLGSELSAVLPALELAACLGTHVQLDEWRIACRMERQTCPEAHLDPLAAAKLIYTEHDAFVFTHNLLRESLLRSARERLRLAGHHRAAAGMLTERYGDDSPAARLAHHALAGKRPLLALNALLQAASNQLDAGKLELAAETVTTWCKAADDAKLGPSDPKRLAGLSLQARTLLTRNEPDAAEAIASTMRDHARRARLLAEEAEALLVLGDLASRRGRSSQAMAHLRAARRLFQRQSMPVREAAALRALADLGRSTGALAQARTLAQAALDLATDHSQDRDIADAHLLLGTIAQQLEEWDGAERHYRTALDSFRQRGLRRGILTSRIGLAETARARREFDAADASYVQAIDEAGRIGSVQAAVLPLNRALIAIERGDYGQASALADEVRPRLEQLRREPLIAAVDVISMVSAAAQGEWLDFDRYALRAEELLTRTGFADGDVARCADLAGDLAAAKNNVSRARKAWKIAYYQWQRLGHDDRAELVRAKRAAT